MSNMKSLFQDYGSQVIAKVKVDNRQTDRQTDRTKTIYPSDLILGHNKTGICPKQT